MFLGDLGTRVCIMGPSNSGKSTLASAVGHSRGLPVIHLDQLRHIPGTNWRLRTDEEFSALHDDAISGANWVIDGNYSHWLPQRLERATGIILLDASTATSILRYLRRSWLSHNRFGGLDGSTDKPRWAMIRHIAMATRTNRRRYKAIFAHIVKPKISLPTTRALNRFYRSEGLDRH